jgi:DNA-binding NarL/FixJ family response regulator
LPSLALRRAEEDLDGGAAPGYGAQAQAALDGLGSELHVGEPLTDGGGFVVEPDPVVTNGDDATSTPLRDRHLDVLGAGVAASISKPLLDDPEHLDLLVGREPDLRVHVQLDVDLAVGRENFHVPTQRGVEPCRASRRGQSENREACLLLRRGRSLLETRQDVLERSARLEHADLRGDCEEVLSEAVVNLARDAGSFVGNGPAELGLRDRPPHPDEQGAVRHNPEEITLEDKVARDDRGQDEVQLREQRKRRGQAHPAVEVATVPAVADAEADHSDEPQNREQNRGEHDGGALDELDCHRAFVPVRTRKTHRGHREHRGHPNSHGDQRRAPRGHPTVGVGRNGYERSAEQSSADQGPCRRGCERATAEHRQEAERGGSESDAPEAAGKQEVERSAVDEKANAREHRDDDGHDRDRRVEREPGLWEHVRRLERLACREEQGPRGEKADEQDLPEKPGPVALGPNMIHASLVGRGGRADKRSMAERILIVDDHPLTRDALAALLAQQGFDVVGAAEDGERAIAEAESLQPDLVLLDLTMPGMDGLTALPRIREQAPACEVVVLTASDAEENLLAAIRAGASGYLLKTEPPEQIAAFLRGVARGDAALSGGVARRLLDRVREGGRLDGIPEAITRALSAREVEVLLLLDEHLGTDEIAQRLFISEHTVRSHVKSLLKKLGVSSRREALERLDTARS